MNGVTPPGKLDANEGPSVDWAKKERRKKTKAARSAEAQLRKRKLAHESSGKGETRFDPMRPSAGFVPDAFADSSDPADLPAFMKIVSRFVKDHPRDDTCAAMIAERIRKSHAPYEIAVAFIVLSLVTGTNNALKRRHGRALERGAKTYYNLARRLKPNTEIPRGLAPHTVDAIFHDLPTTALLVPYAFAVDAFARLAEIFRTSADDAFDEALFRFLFELRDRFIVGRSIGDVALVEMFPWTKPSWAPDVDT